jgi:hypothetical protein
MNNPFWACLTNKTQYSFIYLWYLSFLGPVKHFVVALQKKREFCIPPMANICFTNIKHPAHCVFMLFCICNNLVSMLNHSVMFLKAFLNANSTWYIWYQWHTPVKETIIWQAVNSHMHKLGWGHGYHLVDSNEMHPNFRQGKMSRVHFMTNKMFFSSLKCLIESHQCKTISPRAKEQMC